MADVSNQFIFRAFNPSFFFHRVDGWINQGVNTGNNSLGLPLKGKGNPVIKVASRNIV